MKDGIARSRIAGRLAAVLLATTCLTPLLLTGVAAPALADGGAGGGQGGTGGSGGADSATAAGTAGGDGATVVAGGGGGGAGATGGKGGNGGGASGGTGGPGASAAGGNGSGGNSASGLGGGGGGGGGAHGQVTGTLNSSGLVQGGSGGSGGNSGVGAGGGGGGAGYGAVVSGSGQNSNSGVVAGGGGGGGGTGNVAGNFGGNGGDGGIGVQFSASGATLVNSGIVAGGTGGVGGNASVGATGGNGGRGGAGVSGSGLTITNSSSGSITGGTGGNGGSSVVGTPGTAGVGGVGILGSGLTVITSGTIAGGTAGGGGAQANAITFTGGTNSLELRSGAGFTGNVVAVSGGSDILRLGGSANATFNTSLIGAAAQYRNFAAFEKTGTGTWTLTGTTTATTSWAVSGGALAISADNNLGAAASTLSLAGGTLQTTTTFLSARGVTLGGGTNTLDTNGGTTLTWNGVIGGTGGLTKAGSGRLVLTGASNYTGGTTVQAGILEVGTADGVTAGSVIGAITNASVLNFNVGDTSGVTSIANTTSGLGTHYNRSTSAGTTTITNTNGAVTFFVNNSTAANAIITSSGSNSQTGFGDSSTAGNATVIADNGATTVFAATPSGGQARFVTNSGGSFDISLLTSAGTTAGSIEGAGSYNLGSKQLTVGSNNLSTAVSGVIADGGLGGGAGGSLVKIGTGTLTLTGNNAYTSGTTINGGTLSVSADNNLGNAAGALAFGGGTLQTTGTFATSRATTLNAGGGIFDTASGTTLSHGGAIGGTGGLTKAGTGTLILGGANSYSGGTTVSGGVLQGSTTSLQGNIVNNASVVFDQAVGAGTFAGNISGSGSLTVQGGGGLILSGVNTYSGGTLVSAGNVLQGNTSSIQGNIVDNGSLLFDQATAGTYAGSISGSGSLSKATAGTLTLSGNNTYSGGTTLYGGTLQGTTASLQGNILNNGAVIFNQTGNGTYAGIMSGSGSMTLQGGGLLTLTGTNTYSGATTVNAGTLSVNGSLASTVTVNAGGTLGGTGTIGGLIANGGILAPGNSIGTLTVSGNLTQTGGTYQVEANAAGQSDRVNVGGTATINGATVQVLAQPGTYGRSTTYTILQATGGVSGTYSGVTSNFAFLTPSLSYDANDVFLTLAMAQNAFSSDGRTFNQREVGRVLDQTFGAASGDYATVLNAIAGLSTTQGPLILDAISGQNYAGFSNAMVQGAQLFMTNFANRAGSSTGGGSRVALAEACDVACDAMTPAVWGVWGGAVGGTGTIAGNDNAGTFTYSVGGFSGGLDRKITPNFLAGVTVGYLTGGQWTGGFEGRSVTDTVQAGLYGSFTQGPLYVDALAAYAYNSNQLWRAINIPGLQPRTAYGQTGANQFLGQLEGGWRVDLGGAPGYFITPFGLIQGSVATQNAFTESGAQSLNLSVAQQTTSSLRTIFGAQLGAAMDVGLRDRIAAQLRFGWSHEYSDTARPVTASFAGAPAVPFTVFGAAPTRDGAVIGFSASTAIAEAMGVYLRYEGNIAGQDSSHALTAGLRVTW